MEDTWNTLKSFKQKLSDRREQAAKRRRLQQTLQAELERDSKPIADSTPNTNESSCSTPEPKSNVELENPLLRILGDIHLDLPCKATVLAAKLSKTLETEVTTQEVEGIIEGLATQNVIGYSKSLNNDKTEIEVTSVNRAKLTILCPELLISVEDTSSDDKTQEKENTLEPSEGLQKIEVGNVEQLLSHPTAMEKETKKMNEEILHLLTKKTTKEQSLIEQFRSQGCLQEFCQCGTKRECYRTNGDIDCKKLHFRRIIKAHTDESLGDCSFLNTCFHMESCKYVHYEVESAEKKNDDSLKKSLSQKSVSNPDSSVTMFPPQWIQCDLRHLDMSILGKCSVVMADPPWDIHMELPYGTMGDDEMRKLDVPSLSDDGFLFLWVTGRAMELGRECMHLWGYKSIEELIWVKTNQLQRLIRTGRTGHWINHGKEHCLVGVKGNPKGVNRGLDCDIIVAEVRATSHKPDEIYGIIERLSPGTRKVELFGRPHNVQRNWITLGNQVEGVQLLDPDIVNRFRERYPDGNCMLPPKEKT